MFSRISIHLMRNDATTLPDLSQEIKASYEPTPECSKADWTTPAPMKDLYTTDCQRRALLNHLGQDTPGQQERCCSVHGTVDEGFGAATLGVLILISQLLRAELAGQGTTYFLRKRMDLNFTREVLAASSLKGLEKHGALDEDIMAAIISATNINHLQMKTKTLSVVKPAQRFLRNNKRSPALIDDLDSSDDLVAERSQILATLGRMEEWQSSVDQRLTTLQSPIENTVWTTCGIECPKNDRWALRHENGKDYHPILYDILYGLRPEPVPGME
ncbi:Hypp9678 [Branchiostoma lanceolatum]|uniref:Hypp9678 protein n=1 Tax=Branchiostoma lanceolatum TaxID=7740 RepID=A0A8S4MP56_BRALA|nr:Hypp9678 [Branchiostoma lanceolatum]